MSLFEMHRTASMKPKVSAVFMVHTAAPSKAGRSPEHTTGPEHNTKRIFRRTFLHAAAVSLAVVPVPPSVHTHHRCQYRHDVWMFGNFSKLCLGLQKKGEILKAVRGQARIRDKGTGKCTHKPDSAVIVRIVPCVSS